jgi:hypothetical protein
MRPPRSFPAILGLTALLALPAMAEAKTTVRAVGFQAKAVSISKKTGMIRARVLTAGGGSGLSKYKGKTLSFDARQARLTVVDTNGDGKANTLADIKRNDILGVIGTAPTGPLKVITVTTLTDVTALLPTQNLPAPGALPPLPSGLPMGG